MPLFEYIALDSQGVEVKDEIEALSEKEAISRLQKEGRRQRKKVKEIAQCVVSSDLILD